MYPNIGCKIIHFLVKGAFSYEKSLQKTAFSVFEHNKIVADRIK